MSFEGQTVGSLWGNPSMMTSWYDRQRRKEARERSGLSPTGHQQARATAARVLGTGYGPWEGAGGGVRVGGGSARSPGTTLGASLSPETKANLSSYHMVSPIKAPSSFPSLDDEFTRQEARREGIELALQSQRDAIGATFTYNNGIDTYSAASPNRTLLSRGTGLTRYTHYPRGAESGTERGGVAGGLGRPSVDALHQRQDEAAKQLMWPSYANQLEERGHSTINPGRGFGRATAESADSGLLLDTRRAPPTPQAAAFVYPWQAPRPGTAKEKEVRWPPR